MQYPLKIAQDCDSLSYAEIVPRSLPSSSPRHSRFNFEFWSCKISSHGFH
jgi:hypothetical protein